MKRCDETTFLLVMTVMFMVLIYAGLPMAFILLGVPQAGLVLLLFLPIQLIILGRAIEGYRKYIRLRNQLVRGEKVE